MLQNAEKIELKEKFDVVVTMEVFEHTKADNFMDSIRKVLKKDGLLVISCPNLASWYNRLFLLFGHEPPSYDISDKYKLSTKIYCPCGHRTLVTMKAMERYLKCFGFDILHKAGYPYAEEMKIRKYIDYILPLGLKEGMLFIAKKNDRARAPSTYYDEWIKSGLIYN